VRGEGMDEDEEGLLIGYPPYVVDATTYADASQVKTKIAATTSFTAEEFKELLIAKGLRSTLDRVAPCSCSDHSGYPRNGVASLGATKVAASAARRSRLGRHGSLSFRGRIAT